VSLKTLKENAFPVAFSTRKGKKTRFRGSYRTPTALEQQVGDLFRRLLSSRRAGKKVLPVSTPRMKVREAIREINPTYGLASIWKGAVRHLADNGMPTEQPMRIMDRTSVATLHLSLGYDLHFLKDKITQESAARTLYGQTCSG
jgi:hypothetical protein